MQFYFKTNGIEAKYKNVLPAAILQYLDYLMLSCNVKFKKVNELNKRKIYIKFRKYIERSHIRYPHTSNIMIGYANKLDKISIFVRNDCDINSYLIGK